MSLLPPFEQSGEDGARFYALSYCQGIYGTRPPPGGASVFLTIYFTTAPDYTHFTLHIVDAGGHCFAYFRGDDDLDSPENALLNAWDDFQVSPATWRLFPLLKIPEDTLPRDSEVRAAYFSARSHLCRLFWRFRVRKHFSPPPLFHPDSDFAPPSIMEESDESKEIMQATGLATDCLE